MCKSLLGKLVEDQAVGVVVEDASSGAMSCPICHEEIFSELGKSCKMCGMVLEDPGKEFCSKKCRIKYLKIRKSDEYERPRLQYGS
jgi:hypothetical protein